MKTYKEILEIKITGKSQKSVKIDRMNGSKKIGTIKVDIGDSVEIKANAKPVKGKNKHKMHAAKIEEIIGEFVKLQAYEEGEFWYKVSDVFWDETE